MQGCGLSAKLDIATTRGDRPGMMNTLFSVAIGGAIGACLRYGVGLTVAFPLGTLTVNMIGSFAIGVVWIFLPSKELHHWLPFLMTGLLGGFTTFSAFSLDAVTLYERGQVGAAAGYVAVSVVFSIGALFAGMTLMKGALQ